MANTKDGLAGMNKPELDAPYGKKAKRAIGAFCKDLVVTANLIGELSYLAQLLIVWHQVCTLVCTLVRLQAYPVKLQVKLRSYPL